jgi:hypothetical protein
VICAVFSDPVLVVALSSCFLQEANNLVPLEKKRNKKKVLASACCMVGGHFENPD